jgi:uncharacterized NAD(P)/FAD-binding protein YdhS
LLFGRYLGEILDEAVASGKTAVMDASATKATRGTGGWHVELSDGSTIAAQALVLAVGNQEPDTLGPFAGAGKRFISDPWGPAAQAALAELTASGGRALIIGTGLTMVDLVLSLDAAGHRGKVLALSRRGLIPRAHADFEPAPVEQSDVPSGNLRALWRWLRRRSAEVGWRAAVDSLRPYSHPLWRSLDVEQQRRFLRHARPWWDVHRHRIAPEVARTVAAMIADGRLEVAAGRVVGVQEDGDGLRVEYRKRGAAAAQSAQFSYVFNCTGPLHAIARTRDPLLRSLLDGHHVRPDQLGIGLEVDDRSRACGGERIWALGPLTKGRYWEIIAVPDIREQAAAAADDIALEIKR